MIDSARLPDGSEQEIVEDRQQDEGEESHDKEVGEQDVVPGVGHWQPEVGGTDGGSVSADPGLGGVDKARLQLHEARNVPEQSRKDDRDYVEIARKCRQEVSEIFIHKTLTLSLTVCTPGMDDCDVPAAVNQSVNFLEDTNLPLQGYRNCRPDGAIQGDLDERPRPREDVWVDWGLRDLCNNINNISQLTARMNGRNHRNFSVDLKMIILDIAERILKETFKRRNY